MLFSDVIGQKEVKERLIRSVKENRVSHAQLFLGSTGCGSLAMALAYAQYIHCESRKEGDSCGECKSCIKYSKLVHPDLHFAFPIALSKDVKVSTDAMKEWREAVLANPYLTINDWFNTQDAENKQPIIPVAESGEIIKKLSYTTFESDYKIMIIWMADKMNHEAANKLLKILEEPPDKTVFILTVDTEDKLLKTILSRTQLVKINAIDEVNMMDALAKRHQLPVNDAKSITYLSEGNYSTALALLNENETADFNLATFQLWMRASLKFDMVALNKLMADFGDLGRERQKNFLNYCMHLVRESLMINYADEGLVKVTEKEAEFLRKFSPFIHAGNCLQFADVLNESIMHIERNAHPKILFLDLSFKFNELLNIKQPVFT